MHLSTYLFYSIIFSVLLLATALYLTRARWKHLLPNAPLTRWFYTRLPSSFTGDIESGFSSSHFDLHGNVASGDARGGLDAAAKAAIQRIMKSRKVDFDEGRRIYMQQRFRNNNIGPDGRPRDPKFVSFS
ncbi:hypothetical protein IWX90DRAFT_196165 [Phyllosticta citrichinensis]|uniref:Uncharacterized protein n=1 Tax=Phyllosticta citrichinensis TaxID=1130410 RepID=A0ABR1XX85_9PEZI